MKKNKLSSIDVWFLIASSVKKSYQQLSETYAAIEPPTWALLLAQSTRSVGFNVKIIDANAEKLSKEEFTAIDKYSNHTSLQRIPGSFIKSYGGMAGIVNLSMDGGQPVHTKIILDGIDLTNPQNGQTDLSNIPVEIMQQLYLSRSPNFYYAM